MDSIVSALSFLATTGIRERDPRIVGGWVAEMGGRAAGWAHPLEKSLAVLRMIGASRE